MMTFQEIISYDALFESALKCKAGVMWKNSVAHYILNLADETYKLSQSLQNGTYKELPHKEFTVKRPKQRDIVSIHFRDRVFQRSLNDNAVYPAMTKSLIYDNCACQKGKGTDFARNRLKTHMHRFFWKYGLNGYVLQCDIKGYYPNMRHDVVKAVFRRKLPDEIYDRVCIILDSYPGEVGFNPGSQLIQIAGLAVLDGLDHAAKEKWRVKHYLRYMDDIILLFPTREEAEKCRHLMAEYLAGIGFELHPKKTKIYPLADGIKFLGFHFHISPTGRIWMTLRSENVKEERRRLKKLVRLVGRGRMTGEKLGSCYTAWKAHASKACSYKLIKRMDMYYRAI